MPYDKNSPAIRLTALRLTDNPRWLREVTAAIAKAGTLDGAVKELGVGRSTFYRWTVEDEGLAGIIAALRRRPPAPGAPARPRKRT